MLITSLFLAAAAPIVAAFETQSMSSELTLQEDGQVEETVEDLPSMVPS